MEQYNFWQDFFDTYQSLSDWMKFAWLVVPPAFLLALAALIMRSRLARKQESEPKAGSLAYTVFPEENGILRIYAHEGADMPVPTRLGGGLLALPGASPSALPKTPPSDV